MDLIYYKNMLNFPDPQRRVDAPLIYPRPSILGKAKERFRGSGIGRLLGLETHEQSLRRRLTEVLKGQGRRINFPIDTLNYLAELSEKDLKGIRATFDANELADILILMLNESIVGLTPLPINVLKYLDRLQLPAEREEEIVLRAMKKDEAIAYFQQHRQNFQAKPWFAQAKSIADQFGDLREIYGEL